MIVRIFWFVVEVVAVSAGFTFGDVLFVGSATRGGALVSLLVALVGVTLWRIGEYLRDYLCWMRGRVN
jgi:hypothetical protein